MGKAFDKIAAGLNEAIAIAHGEAEPAALHVPSEIDVKAIRKAAGFSQQDFARQYGFTMEQIRAWEQNRARPLGGVRAYLMVIGADPKGVADMLRQAVERQAA